MSNKDTYMLLQHYPSLPKDWEEGMVVGYGDRSLQVAPVNSKYSRKWIPAREVRDSEDFWEKVSESTYRILKVKPSREHPSYGVGATPSKIINYEEHKEEIESHKDWWEIYSVVRISDRKVFTIGDKVRLKPDPPANGSGTVYEIDGFSYVYNSNRLELSLKNAGDMSLRHAIHAEPVLITEDEEDKYKGDRVYTVYRSRGSFTVVEEDVNKHLTEHNYGRFSDYDNAVKKAQRLAPKFSMEVIDKAYWKAQFGSTPNGDFINTEKFFKLLNKYSNEEDI